MFRFSCLQDPREALILTLKHTVNNLESENDYLRSMLRTFNEVDRHSCKSLFNLTL